MCDTSAIWSMTDVFFEVGWRMFGAWKLPFFFVLFGVFFVGMDRLIKWINVWQLGRKKQPTHFFLGGSAVLCSLE